MAIFWSAFGWAPQSLRSASLAAKAGNANDRLQAAAIRYFIVTLPGDQMVSDYTWGGERTFCAGGRMARSKSRPIRPSGNLCMRSCKQPAPIQNDSGPLKDFPPAR